MIMLVIYKIFRINIIHRIILLKIIIIPFSVPTIINIRIILIVPILIICMIFCSSWLLRLIGLIDLLIRLIDGLLLIELLVALFVFFFNIRIILYIINPLLLFAEIRIQIKLIITDILLLLHLFLLIKNTDLFITIVDVVLEFLFEGRVDFGFDMLLFVGRSSVFAGRRTFGTGIRVVVFRIIISIFVFMGMFRFRNILVYFLGFLILILMNFLYRNIILLTRIFSIISCLLTVFI